MKKYVARLYLPLALLSSASGTYTHPASVAAQAVALAHTDEDMQFLDKVLDQTSDFVCRFKRMSKNFENRNLNWRYRDFVAWFKEILNDLNTVVCVPVKNGLQTHPHVPVYAQVNEIISKLYKGLDDFHKAMDKYSDKQKAPMIEALIAQDLQSKEKIFQQSIAEIIPLVKNLAQGVDIVRSTSERQQKINNILETLQKILNHQSSQSQALQNFLFRWRCSGVRPAGHQGDNLV